MPPPTAICRLGLEDVREKIRTHPLFASLDAFEVVEFEIELFWDPSLIPAGHPRRPSYFRCESLPPGRVLASQGDLGTELAVLLDGSVSSYRSEPSEGTELVENLRPGDWFGETSALSHIPSLTSFRTDTPCDIAFIDARLFKKLYREEETFKEAVDRRYKEKSLILHLKSAPLFRSLSRRDLAGFQDQVEFVTFPEEDGGEVVASEGDEAEAFFLVRGGAVRCFRKDPRGKEVVLAYYMANSSFGEHAVATTASAWPGTYETLTRTDVVRIPRAVFERVSRERPEVQRTLTRAANLIVDGDPAKVARLYTDGLGADEIDVMVYRESVKGGEALVIDKTKCIRCNACVEACVSVHEDRVPRITKVGTKVASDQMLITACYHCAIPDCMASCNYGAIRRDAQGVVVFVYDNCVGCSSCVEACPYDVIRMTVPRERAPVEERGGPLGWLRRLFGRQGGRAASPAPGAMPPEGEGSGMKVTNFGTDEKDRTVEVMAKAIKCDLCAGLPFEACVYNCPTYAIDRRRPEDLFRS